VGLRFGELGRQLKFWHAGAGAGGEQLDPILSIAALVDVTQFDPGLLGPPALTALAEVTPAPVPEATSLPPPQEAKVIMAEMLIVIFLRFVGTSVLLAIFNLLV
jgi:hypothetical protein